MIGKMWRQAKDGNWDAMGAAGSSIAALASTMIIINSLNSNIPIYLQTKCFGKFVESPSDIIS